MSFLQRYLQKTKGEDQDPACIAFLASLCCIEKHSPDIARHIIAELEDQRSSLKLIASENYSSLAVQLCMGNHLTDKYAEGVPKHRFYAGCENVDAIEEACISTLKQLFGADHAYVQPHSGADANLVAFWTILTYKIQEPWIQSLGYKKLDELSEEEYQELRQALCQQKILGMSLSAGGHLTHGYRHNVSGKMFQAISYGVDPRTGLLDYEQLAEQAKKEKPLILLAGYSAYPRRIDFKKMREIADSVGAVLMVDMAHFAGLVAGKVFRGRENPIPYADIVTSTTHKTLRGPRGGFVLCTSEYAGTLDKGCPLVLGGPLPHVIAAKCLAFREADSLSFQNYAQNIVDNAQSLAKALIDEGLSLITGGTDNHIILIDLRSLPINGRQAELALCKAKITLNRNAIPQDPQGPWYTSGIRLGTAALTSLGMGKEEMKEIASMIADLLFHTQALGKSRAKSETERGILEKTQKRCKALLQNFPLYPELDLCYTPES